MSGGRFQYKQHDLTYISDELDLIIKHSKGKSGDEEYDYNVPEDILEYLIDISADLKYYSNAVHHIDYYLSGDHGEESFREKISELDEQYGVE